ncbi:MAG: hypothetical protein IJO81_03455 [Clostridia bacterium]|nr:hypothetical protein [Clostridia bacterium]
MQQIDIKSTFLYKFVVILAWLEGIAGVIGFFVLIDEIEIGVIFPISAVFAILSLFAYFSIATHYYQAAVDKGYTSTYYLNLAFFFPFAGYGLVNALPDRGNISVQDSSVVDDSLPEL